VARKDDINSTERLLNVIRGKSPEKPAGEEEVVVKKNGKKTAKFIDIYNARHRDDKKRYTIGVDFGQGFIGLAKAIKASDGRPMLLEHKIVKYDHLTTKNTPEFNNLLKSALVSFCGSLANCSIWTMMPAGEVNVHYLKIPQVPRKQLENVIYWTAKKETAFDDKSTIFDLFRAERGGRENKKIIFGNRGAAGRHHHSPLCHPEYFSFGLDGSPRRKLRQSFHRQ